jgi:serine/threonine-protein kinase HipA
MKRKEIFVYADWEELGKSVLMGILSVDVLRGKEIFSFEYSDVWLKSNYTNILDPDLGFYSGIQYLID